MSKGNRILCAAIMWILSMTVMAGAVFGAQDEPEGRRIDPGNILGDVRDSLKDNLECVAVPDFEGTIKVTAADGMRDAIADHFRSEDDMSWIRDAEILLKGKANESRGAEIEAAFQFNGTELYHLRVSYDRKQSILYLQCPELKEQVFAFPVGDFSADAQTITGRKITPEMIAEYMSVLKELNDLVKSISLETIQSEWIRYASALLGYVQQEKGFATITAGSLSEEGNTTTWTIEAQDLKEMIPKALKMLSEDELLQHIMLSPFAEHVFRLAVGGKASSLIPKGTLWQFVQQALARASAKDYVKGHSVSATLALDRDNHPIQLAASLEKNGIKAELFRISAILDGEDHALEVKFGPALVKKAGFHVNQSTGAVIQGSLKDDILRETVSIRRNGSDDPVFLIRNLDLLTIRDAWLSGAFTVIWKNRDYTCDFFTDENGLRTMRFDVNGVEWFTLTADVHEVEDTDIKEMDVSDAFVVDSRKAFFKYMRDASAIRMFEKLSSAEVPQEYVDMLTDGEAATESSRENTVELE